MQFIAKKRRQPPAIIIVSLIDILIVLLIFLMVATTFKERPTVKITLPESNQGNPGFSEEGLVVTIGSQEPFFFFKGLPTTLEKLQQALATEARLRPSLSLTIQADKAATIENGLKVTDVAKAAGIEKCTLNVKQPLTK